MVRRFGSYSGFATVLLALVAAEGCSVSHGAVPAQSAPPALPESAAPPPSAEAAKTEPVGAPAASSANACPPPAPVASAAPVAPSAESQPKPSVDETQKPAVTPPERPLFVSIVDDPPRPLPKAGHTKKASHATSSHHTKNSKQSGVGGGSEPHVGINVTATEGQPSLQRTSRTREPQFRACYETGLRRDQEMKGDLEIELALGADGRVEQSKLKATTLGDPNVEMCVVREASGLTFADPRGVAHTFSVRLSLHPGEDPVAVPAPLPHADALVDDLAKVRPEVEQCYRDGLLRHPNLGGPLTFKFKVRPSGEVFEVGESETHFADLDTTRCIARAYRTNKLGPLHSKGGRKDTSFLYTLHLEADGPLATSRAN